MPYVFGEELKSQLRVPMGPVSPEMPSFKAGSRIIAIGDIVILGLIKAGIKPFAAAFDLRTRRAPISKEDKEFILKNFPNPLKASNPPGTLTEEAISAAEKAMSEGGGVFVDGEEDLTLLAFMKFAKKGDVFVYGIMDAGVCVIQKDAKKIAERFLKRAPPA